MKTSDNPLWRGSVLYVDVVSLCISTCIYIELFMSNFMENLCVSEARGMTDIAFSNLVELLYTFYIYVAVCVAIYTYIYDIYYVTIHIPCWVRFFVIKDVTGREFWTNYFWCL